jgi:hypothetical protein
MGPLQARLADITLAQTDSWDDENSNGFQKTEYETKLGLDLNKLRGFTGESLGETFWNIAPDSVYASYGFGAVDIGSGSSTEDRTRDFSAGANWGWDGGYSYLNYRQSHYDNRQSGSKDDDRLERGFDFGGGMWGSNWDLNGWLSLSRSEQMGEWTEATELSFGSGLSMSYKPDDSPDLKLSLGSDNFRGDYIASEGTSRSGSWVFTSEVDFTKYWAELWGDRPSNLGMVFQLRNDHSFQRWGGDADRESETNYFIGLKMDVGLQD